MKKLISLFVILVFISFNDSLAKGPFNLADNNLNIGIGVGSTLYGNTTIPPISASYEIGFPWTQNNFTKNISVGGYLGFSQTEYDWSWGTWSYTYIIIGARGSYHFYSEDNIDAYGGLMLGYNIVSHSYQSKTGYDDYDYGTAGASSGIDVSAFVGGRYYFSPAFGVYAELGYGIAYLNLGVTLKL